MNSYIRKSILLILDIILVGLSLLISYFLRFDGIINFYFEQYKDVVAFVVAIYITSNWIFGLYNKMWRYASIQELLGIFWATTCSALINYIFFWGVGIRIPRSVILINWILSMFFIGGSRFTYRVLRERQNKVRNGKNKLSKKRLMIIGGGNAGANLVKELVQNPESQYKPVVIVDDAEWKINSQIFNVPIKGTTDDIQELVDSEEIEEIIIAIPSASKSRIKEIVTVCQETSAIVKILPSINYLINGKVEITQVRDVEITDLLGRDEVILNTCPIDSYIKNQVCLVTGGGGSIGSEIVRQLVKFEPKEIVILDIYENNAYDLQQSLKRHYPTLNFRVIIASVRDKERISSVFNEVKPSVVFHAAAHKHVPFMEENPSEAIKNNIFGTLNVAQCAHESRVKRFILISTDKAVNPTNIMGATKRIAELIIQSINSISETEFVAVRFGNVLGSNGSVIPLFKEQIKAGGPVTITHPDITRYFMTIPEASRLVIQAGALANGGEIFVLDMGEPVKILDLATQLIELSGYKPYLDIQIDFIGLRPGEKLYEELLLEEEGLESTKQEGILIARPSKVSYYEILEIIQEIKSNMYNVQKLKHTLKKLVPSVKVDISEN
jgi:FlaA1/EpsC-like NDP-sugar epimerase